MAENAETLLNIAFARQSLALHLLRVLFRERAKASGQTRDDILRWGEELKQQIEQQRLPRGEEAYVTAAADEFVNALAADVHRDRSAGQS